jgi:cobalt-zinc-cadmium efflux system protein
MTTDEHEPSQRGHDHDTHAGHSHGHGHGHGHGHSHAPANFDRAFAIGVALNLAFVGVEAVYGILAHSIALLADAGHNLSDVAGLVLAWGAAWLSRRRPTSQRTYGYGRTTILAALANAGLLLVAIGAIAWESVRRFADPEPVQGGTVMLVAAIGIVINAVTALLFMRGRKGDLNVRGAFLHMAADAAVSVGVVIAGLIIILTGWLWLDPVVSLVIVLVIAVGTWGLLKDSVAMAIDTVPAQINPDQVTTYLSELPGVTQVHDLHIWPLSTTSTALTAHLVRPEAVIDDGFNARIAAELQSKFGIGHATIQIECGSGDCDLEPSHVV